MNHNEIFDLKIFNFSKGVPSMLISWKFVISIQFSTTKWGNYTRSPYTAKKKPYQNGIRDLGKKNFTAKRTGKKWKTTAANPQSEQAPRFFVPGLPMYSATFGHFRFSKKNISCCLFSFLFFFHFCQYSSDLFQNSPLHIPHVLKSVSKGFPKKNCV